MDLQQQTVLDPVLRETLFHISSLSAAQQQQLQQFLSASAAPQAANTANTAYTANTTYTADITPLHSSDSPEIRYYKLQGTYAFDPSYRMASEPMKVEQFVLTNFRSFVELLQLFAIAHYLIFVYC